MYAIGHALFKSLLPSFCSYFSAALNWITEAKHVFIVTFHAMGAQMRVEVDYCREINFVRRLGIQRQVLFLFVFKRI